MEILKGFIDWLLKTSLNGSLLVGIILFIKAVLDRRIGAREHYYIWLLLIIRMIMPFSPQSIFSVYNLLELKKDNIMITGHTNYGQHINGFAEEPFLGNLLFSESFLNSTDFKIIVVWLIGVLVFSILTIRVNLRFRQRIKVSQYNASEDVCFILQKCKSTMKINKKIGIVFTEAVDAPALTGLFKPKILIPSYMERKLDYEQYRHIFLHELTHYKRKDIYIFALIGIIQIIHWFNPVIWFGFVKMRQDCEVACDSLTLSYLDKNEYKNYGHTIIHMLQNFKSSFQPVVAIGVLGNRREIKRRIKMISNYKKNPYKISIIALIIFIVLGFTFLTSADKVEENEIDALSGQETGIEMQWPVPDYFKITSPYGWRVHPIIEEERFHSGIDIPAPKGTDIIATAEGKVIYAGWLSGYGKTVIISHGQDVTTLYGQCSEYFVEEDEKVKAGEKIAEVGSTGMATGPHLHFEVRENEEPVDPIEYFNEDNN